MQTVRSVRLPWKPWTGPSSSSAQQHPPIAAWYGVPSRICAKIGVFDIQEPLPGAVPGRARPGSQSSIMF